MSAVAAAHAHVDFYCDSDTDLDGCSSRYADFDFYAQPSAQAHRHSVANSIANTSPTW